MTTLLLGIFIGAILVVFCLWCMERGEGVTNEEIEAWLDWREEWKRQKNWKERELK